CLTAVEDEMEVESQNQQSIVGPFEVVDAVMTKGMDHHHFLVKPRWVNQIMQQTARALVGFGSLPSTVSIEEQKQIQYQHHDVDVLVIGAGLSGREVATALEAAHMRVVTFDRRDLFDLTS